MKLPPDRDSRYADLAARVLSSVEPPATPITVGDRGAGLAALERALGSRARRRLRPWLIGGVAGVAAAAAVAVLVAGWRGSPDRAQVRAVPLPAGAAAPAFWIAAVNGNGASVELEGATTPALDGAALVPGARVRGPVTGDVVLALATGTRVRLAADSRMQVLELGATQRLHVESGVFAADVAKLGPGGRFIVDTPDTEIEVRGTRFDVAVDAGAGACAAGVRTRVTVHEGVVAVRHDQAEVHVVAGRAWPECTSPAAPVAAADETPRRVLARHSRAVPAPPEATAEVERTSPVPPPSTLAEQNDLLAAALAARRRGDLTEALHWLDQLIARYPQGQLLGTAHAERRRLLEGGLRGDQPQPR